MKNKIFNAFLIVTLLVSTLSVTFSQSQNTVGYKTLIGRYKVGSANGIMCPCNTQGLFRYYFNDKEELLIICFDNVKTDYYQIYNDEIITIEGTYITKTCNNGKNYLVFEVENYSFDDNTMQRQLLKPAFNNNKSSSSAVKPIPKTEASKQVTSFTGIYYSKRGVMSPISCFGYNIGNLTLPVKESADVIICFDRLPGGSDLNINCSNKVYVEGYYENKTISGGGSCASGTKKIFYVTKWSCK